MKPPEFQLPRPPPGVRKYLVQVKVTLRERDALIAVADARPRDARGRRLHPSDIVREALLLHPEVRAAMEDD